MVLRLAPPSRWARRVNSVRVAHPRWNVPLAVQISPDVDSIAALDIEDEMGVSLQRPRAQWPTSSTCWRPHT